MIWETEEQGKYAPLRGRGKADVAVIGGGLSGVTIALWLSRAGLRVALVEAERIGWGASGKSAVFSCNKFTDFTSKNPFLSPRENAKSKRLFPYLHSLFQL